MNGFTWWLRDGGWLGWCVRGSVATVVGGCFLALAQADLGRAEVVLHDGREFEGVIVSADANGLVLEVEVTETMKERRSFGREEVAQVNVVARDVTRANELAEMLPLPELSGEKVFEAALRRVRDFLEEFPQSDRLEDVRRIESVLMADLDRVREGSLLMHEQWLTVEQLEVREAEVEALERLVGLQQALDDGYWPTALNRFESLLDGYEGTRAHLLALRMALGEEGQRGFLQRYRGVLQQMVTGLERYQAEFSQQDLERMQTQRSEAQERGETWLPFNPYDRSEIEQQSEVTREVYESLAQRDLAALADVVEGLEELYELVDDGDLVQARQRLQDLAQGQVQLGERVREVLDRELGEEE